jgi:ArsR family transcriptional regulator
MDDLIQIAKVFSDKNRVMILTLLLRYKEVCVCEICDTLKLSQPLVSRHLKQMKKADILSSKQEGKWCVYSIGKNKSYLLECFKKEIRKNVYDLPTLISCKRR